MNLFERIFGRRPSVQEAVFPLPTPELQAKPSRLAKYQPDGWPNPAVFLADVPVGRQAAVYLRAKPHGVNQLSCVIVAVEETPQKGNERVLVRLEDNSTVILAGGTAAFKLPWAPGPEFSRPSPQPPQSAW